MKKSLLFGFAAALTLASCTTNDEVLDAAVQTPMEFSSFVNNGTKAGPVDSSQTLEASGYKMGVWGYKAKTGALSTEWPVFVDVQGTTVGGSSDNPKPVSYENSKWTYTPNRYWDKTCTYNFHAYVPAGEASVVPSINSEKTISFGSFTVNPVIREQLDIMVANPVTSIVPAAVTPAKIQFTFNHILTKVNVTFATSLQSPDVVVLKKATLQDVKTTSAGYNGTSWTEPTTPISFASTDLTKTLTATAEPIFTGMLMIPQNSTTNALNLYVEYTINDEKFSRVIDMKGTEWTKNSNITYNVSIGAHAIDFGVQKVNGWVDKDATDSPNDDTTVS